MGFRNKYLFQAGAARGGFEFLGGFTIVLPIILPCCVGYKAITAMKLCGVLVIRTFYQSLKNRYFAGFKFPVCHFDVQSGLKLLQCFTYCAY